MRVGPRRSVVLPIEEQLTSTPQLLLRDCSQETNGFGDMLGIAVAVDEQAHDQQVGLFGVNPLDLALRVAPGQRAPLKELDGPGAIADRVSHADHFMRVIADDPQRLSVRNTG